MSLALYTKDAPAALEAPRLKELIEFFLSEDDLKPSTRSRYRITLSAFFSWVAKRGYSLNELTRTNIIEYKTELLSSGRSSLTIASYLTSVKTFYAWAEGVKLYPNIAKGVELPKRVRKFRKSPLSPRQCQELLSFYEAKALRDYAIVSLLLRTGIRTIEAIRANIEDITYKGAQRVLRVHGKGRDEKDAFVVLTDKAYNPIKAYLESRGRVMIGEPLFISASNNSKGERLTTRTISLIAKEGLKAIGLDGKEFTAHSLRHTTIVNIRRAGGTLEQAQAVARHTSISTTQIYDEIFREEERLKNAPEALLDALY